MTEVRRSVTVRATPDRAFEVFVTKFADWWPLSSHHIGESDAATATIEPFEGGRWFERGVDGSECDWGAVLAYEPPTRLLLSWHLDGRWSYDPDPARASEVELTFEPEGATTVVTLVHRHFERHAVDPGRIAKQVAGGGGWGGLLEMYAAVV
ncbi:SRPBCC family protein [Saccharothrix sp.]|uniref:SRPBCC family protein n=1 Tax=Saccharothrix sp. TaxID=1873460 RepID=UPI002811F612|nr:SRPBCC family protein [Saccharothrix sp.]